MHLKAPNLTLNSGTKELYKKGDLFFGFLNLRQVYL